VRRHFFFMHAGTILLLWMMAALLAQMAEGWRLAALAAASLAGALMFARLHCARLLMRVRVLLLAILALFAWFTPGEAVLMDWPRLSPSREGLLLALAHAGRLLAVVCWVAILLARMSTDRLVSGLYTLARPFGVFGLSAERLALRLLLVLRYVEAARGSGRDWRHWLSAPAEGGGETVHLTREHPGAADAVALAVAASLLAAALW
jgi:energy-coupling factor transporter transmembrane protein EcfT